MNAVLLGQRSRPSAFAGCTVCTQNPPKDSQAQILVIRYKGHSAGFSRVWRGESKCHCKKACVFFSCLGAYGSIRRLKMTPAHPVRPNTSLKASPKSVAHWPSSAGASPHFALAVQRATLSVPP